MEKIPPKYHYLYDYDFDQTQDHIMILLPIPKGFDTDTITIKWESSTDNQQLGVTISIPNSNIPLICGTLYDEVNTESTETIIINTEANEKYHSFYQIKIPKMLNLKWKTLISKRHPITNQIDPKSSYLMYVIMGASDEPEDKHLAEEEIAYSVSLGLPVASRVYSQLLFDQGKRDEGIQLLKSVSDEYNDLDAMCQIGRILAWQPETRKDGLSYLKKASSLGRHDVDGLIGRILSPVSEFDYDAKNAKEAIHFLESSVKTNASDDAEFLKNNAELQRILKYELNGENEANKKSTIISVAAVALSFVIGGALLYHFKKRR